MSDDGSPGACKNFGIWVAIASNVCWLLILSYIVSMVHSEYSQLDKQQDKLGATIKTMPDEWHDKAHTLEMTLYHKLFDLQQSMKNLTDDLMQLRAYVQQQSQPNDMASVELLEKNVADLGATLSSLKSEIDSLKNRSIKVQEVIAGHTTDIQYMQQLAIQRHLNETDGALEDPLNKKELAALKNATNSIRERLDKVNETFTNYATIEGQKVTELEKNHTNKINDLNDSVANVTAQDVNKAMKNYQDAIAGMEIRITSLEKVAGSLEEVQKGLRSELDEFSALQRLQSPGRETKAAAGGDTDGKGTTASINPGEEAPKGTPVM